MGSSASKAVRRLPKRVDPSWAGKRTPNPAELKGETHREQVQERPPLASEQKTEAIEKDAGDPHFLANLNRLGPVRVDHHMKTVRPEERSTKELFDSRRRSEEAASPTGVVHNKLYAPVLSELLDLRKGANTKAELNTLADRYNIDGDKLESVARFVSSPSVGRGGAKRFVDKDGTERILMKAIWVEPAYNASAK